ncbi:MAG: hypothetical protein Q8P76_01445 [bacterium]|nr:hypothetical protein [bacterium]
MSSSDIYNQKWRKFLSRVWLFKFIPFVDFVLAAGSLVTGNPHENSDFDVIVGARQGRVFTARAFCILAFGLFGWRRRGVHKFISYADAQVDKLNELDLKTYKLKNLQTSDKFCFNHFVTPAAYRLSEPHNDYWKKLYSSLAPVYGEPEVIQKFFDANEEWMGPVRNSPPKGSFGPRLRAGVVSNGIRWLLSGLLGNWLEKKLKAVQIKRIESGLEKEKGYKPRIIYNDNELEFHPDTKRTELH